MFEKVEIVLLPNQFYEVRVTKSFAAEHGGGVQTFTEAGTQNIHRALDVAKGMVTCSPSLRSGWFEKRGRNISG